MKFHTFHKIMAFLSVILCLTPAAFAITVNDLLSNTTKTITYSSNLAFTDRGKTVDVVNDPNFREDRGGDYDYYAVAYKITLQVGNHIEIHSSKEWDSYLYLYRANGTGGYIYIDHNDDYYDNNDSYLDFTADIAGDYYIVVTDIMPDKDGRYYLTVWNTDNEPTNSLTTSYTEIDYSSIVVGSPKSGTLTQSDISDLYSYYGAISAQGHKLSVQAGKAYQITAKFTGQGVSSSAGFYLLGSLDGYDDVIDNEGAYYQEYTARINYVPNTSGTIYILLYDRDENNLSYTVTVEEVLSYTEISYPNIPIGTPQSGTLNAKVMVHYERDYDHYSVYTAAGYSFNAIANKTYKITVRYTQSEPSEIDAELYILKNSLQGYLEDDRISGHGDWEENVTELTLTGFYKSSTAGNAKILLSDYYGNGLNYTVTVEEVANIIFYTDFSYSSQIPTNGTPVDGTSTDYIGFGYQLTGKDHNFNAEANSIYKITCTFNSAQIFHDDDFGVLLLKSGTLQGTEKEDIIYYSDVNNSSQGTKQGTLTGYFKATATEQLKVLLYDFNQNSYTYAISIEKVNIPSYTDPTYVYLPLTLGTPQSGTLKPIIGVDRWGDYDTYFTTGQGYRFAVEDGKKYKITVRYTNPQYTPDYDWEAGFYLLNSGSLSGGHNDVYDDKFNYTYSSSELAVAHIFTAPSTGNMRILLQNDRSRNAEELGYTIEVDEVPPPITLAQFLNNTTKIITYSDNLAFTDKGTMVYAVNDPNDPNFGNGEHYAVAYKITLQAGNHIKIHSSKEGDSYLYLFYRANGTGGYMYIDHNDDDDKYDKNDSYLDFTADIAGDYYIIVTDYNPDRDGRYYLTVWNTGEEPENRYDLTPIVAKAPKTNTSSLKASAQNGTLHLSGLTTGKAWSVYTVSGTLVHKGVAGGAEANLPLNASGVYLVKSNGQAIRVINR